MLDHSAASLSTRVPREGRLGDRFSSSRGRSKQEAATRETSELMSNLGTPQIQGSIDHISETLDVLIEGAMEQTTHESDSAKALQKVAHDMHEQEVRTSCPV